MKRFGIAAAILMLVLAVVPTVDAATTWTARFSGRGLATVRVGSPTRLTLGLTGFRAGTTWTVSLRRGSCASAGTLVRSVRVTASSTGRLGGTVTLTAAQTRAAKLPLTLRFGTRCASFAAPAAAPGTITDGTWRVGTAIQPGTYRTAGSDSLCYWTRLSGFGGSLDEIIESELAAGPQVVTIAPTDAGFASSRCGTWRLNAPAVPTVSPGDGTWRVGLDIVPGTYEVTVPEGGLCYWSRLSGFGGSLDEIITSDLVSGGPAIVTIDAADAGFRSSRCGRWTLTGVAVATPTPSPTPAACAPAENCIGSVINFGGVFLSVRDVYPWAGQPGLQPAAGRVFIAVEMRLDIDPGQTAPPWLFSVRGPSGQPSYPLVEGLTPMLVVPTTSDASARRVSGFLTFEVLASDAGALALSAGSAAIRLY